jgi:hypothetical protein
MENKENNNVNEQEIKEKIEQLRKFSHSGVSEEKLRQGALIALGIKKVY